MKLKSKYDKKYKILQLDGGGLKGVIFLVLLVALEEALKKPCYKIFNLVIGTSTGGITATAIANGYSAKYVLNMYIKNAKRIFNRRLFGYLNPASWFTGATYKRKFVDNLVKDMFKLPMNKLKCGLIVTGVNMRDALSTHYFKSYKKKYKNVVSCYPVMATYSAPTYFGYFNDKKDYLLSMNKKGGVWADGGVGVENCTLLQAYIESQRLGNKKNYWILSCGTGYTGLCEIKQGLFSQIKSFIPIAREQAVQMQVSHCRELKINFTRADIIIKKVHNEMDKPKYINNYLQYGRILSKSILANIFK